MTEQAQHPEREMLGYASANYELCVADYTDEVGRTNPLYQVIHSEHGVVEYMDHVLPRAINMITVLQDELDKAVGEFRKPKLVATGGNDDGEAGLH